MNHMKTDAETQHVRRCHICGTVNETESGLVEKCSGCGKFFAPFVFFDEKAALGLVDAPKDDVASLMNNRLRYNEQHQDIKSQYPPLWGLTVYW